jgi:Holliday junction resolvasome RuvABC endonuclease subunit
MIKGSMSQASLFGGSTPVVDPFNKPTTRRERKDHHILALDVATTTGWCDAKGSGVWKCAVSSIKNEEKILGKYVGGKRLMKFEKNLTEHIEQNDIRLVVFEKAFIYHSKDRRPNFASFEMIGVLKMVCAYKNVKMMEYITQHIKKFATGKGNAGKEQMIASAEARYGVRMDDDNEADALHLYHLAIQDLRL